MAATRSDSGGSVGESRTATRSREVGFWGLGKVKVVNRDGFMVSNVDLSNAIDVRSISFLFFVTLLFTIVFL